jgi:hypothetical protein
MRRAADCDALTIVLLRTSAPQFLFKAAAACFRAHTTSARPAPSPHAVPCAPYFTFSSACRMSASMSA